MKDSRVEILAKNLVTYSCNVQKGEKVLIDLRGANDEIGTELVKQVYKVGGIPFLTIRDSKTFRSLLKECTEEQMSLMMKYDLERAKDMDAYIVVVTSDNASELSDVPRENLEIYAKYYSKPIVADILTPNTKWVLLNYPTAALAQKANMSTESFEDFLFNVCNLDYSNLSKAMDPLVELINSTENVRIIGKGTDLSFSVKGMNAIKCDGKYNIPDGEVFTAPVKDAVNGYITYNTPNEYQGTTYDNIRLEFENGKIIKASSSKTEALNNLLDTDEGARFIGEFALGVNPYITNPMTDTLFDEKIAGSFHFTPGRAYDDCDNGNRSAIHMDLVCIQRPEYGGGEIYFDDVLIRKDGLFVLEELQCLNPDKLKKN